MAIVDVLEVEPKGDLVDTISFYFCLVMGLFCGYSWIINSLEGGFMWVLIGALFLMGAFFIGKQSEII